MRIRIKETQENINLDEMRNDFKELKYYQDVLKSLNFKTNKYEWQYIQEKIKALKMRLKNYCSMVFMIYCDSKEGRYYEVYTEYPKLKITHNDKLLKVLAADDILKGFKGSFISKIRELRNERKKINKEMSEYLGIAYEKEQGVFKQKASILNIKKKINPMNRLQRAKVPHNKIKDNYIGIELELICLLDRTQLSEVLIKNKLEGYVNVRDDGSLHPEKSGERAHEITLLCKLNEAEEIVKTVCNVLVSQTGAYVNNSCGLHVHLDARNANHEIMFNNLVKGLPLLSSLVPPNRINNRYCAQNLTPNFEESFTNFYNHEDNRRGSARYQAINPESYNKYKTIEVRLHSGSINAKKILMWVKTIALLGYWPTKLDATIWGVEDLKTVLGYNNEEHLKYLTERIKIFADKKIKDTREDHFLITG